MDPRDIICSYNIDHREADAILEVYNSLVAVYDLSFDPQFDFDFRDLHCFYQNRVSAPGPVLAIKKNNRVVHLTFVQVSSRTGRSNSSDHQMWGVVKLDRQQAHTLIKHETILDKIHDRIHSFDIDFDDDPKFSKRFLVASNDETKARLFLNNPVRDLIKNIDAREIMIETIGNSLVIGNESSITPRTAVAIVKFMCAMAH